MIEAELLARASSSVSMATVAHILWSGDVGGAERAVYQLALNQQRRRRRITLVFGQSRGYYRDLAVSSDLEVVDLGMRSGRDLIGAARAQRALRQFGIHHFHSAEPLLMLAS